MPSNQLQPLEAFLGVRELLGRPVAERVERDATLVEIAQDGHGVLMSAPQCLCPALIVGAEDVRPVGVIRDQRFDGGRP